MRAELKEEFRSLSREDLLQKAHDLGVAYEKHSFGCAQCTVAALYRILDFPDALVKAASSNAGGAAGQLLGTCGGMIGGMMILDYFNGRPFDQMSDSKIIPDPNIASLSRAVKLSQQLPKKFIDAYGGFNCANVQMSLFSRVFYLGDDDDMRKFEAAGGHTDPQKCLGVVGNGAKWALEILLDNEIVSLE